MIDIGFILTYIVTPAVIGIGILNGREKENHMRLGVAFCFKGIFYLYCAILNMVHYINNTWGERYVIGLAVAIAIIEWFSGMGDCCSEFKKHWEK